MTEHTPTPVLQSIVLCDWVYTDAATGKKVLAGTFNTLCAQEFPTAFARSTFVYLCLTDVHHEARVDLRYLDLAENVSLLSLDGIMVMAPSPLDSVEAAIEIPPLPMPHPGAYLFEVACGGVSLGSVRILVTKLTPDVGSNGHARH